MPTQPISFDLSGKRVLITGASRGAGFGIAKAFAAAGAEVVATARNEVGLERLRTAIESVGGKVHLVAGDLSTREGARDVARCAGEIDVLVNNAALTTGRRHSQLEPDDENWDMEFAINLNAPITLMQSLVPGMVARGGGSVINISSIGAKRPSPDHVAYGASKAAMEAASQAFALDVADKGVRVNVVQLGLTETEALYELLPPGLTAESMGWMFVPRGRAANVSEVAALCLFLASEESAAIVGAVLTVDGGSTAGTFAPRNGSSPE